MTPFPNPPKYMSDRPDPPSIRLYSAKVGLLTFDTGIVSSFVAATFEGSGGACELEFVP